jgi:hypothetical protein
MAKFVDLMTGNVLDTSNAFTIGQYRGYPDRYQEERENTVEPVQETVEAEERPAKKAGRPKKTN